MAGLWPAILTIRHPQGHDLVMRGLRRSDKEDWEELRRVNRDWLAPWEATSPHGQPASRFRAVMRDDEREARAGRLQPFVVSLDRRLVGQMHLFNIVWGSARGGSAGYWIDRRHAGRGLAPLCLAALVDHALYGLGLHRVEVNVRPENTASLRVIDKLGFREEGLRQRFLHIGGDWRDHHSFALTAEDLQGASLLRRWLGAQSADGDHKPLGGGP